MQLLSDAQWGRVPASDEHAIDGRRVRLTAGCERPSPWRRRVGWHGPGRYHPEHAVTVPGRADRGLIERNSIAVTSRLAEGSDPPSPGWLGRHAPRPEISQSGLWNVDHIRHHREPGFPDRLDQLIQQQR